MANQSLYRRYRPRRFSELKGQDHIVRALRTSVAEGREGQAYLFSGPRGTGKTTSARILAKVLNCQNPQGGEPCCECDSCLSVEKGTSYDVHELDAASNNGVDAMRDLIEKASLGTPGRHKVYILDEVHMLSKGAEAALLKTLEEPPPHVVFVLATTDPQKMSDTIRSRTQHLQFHLLGADTLQEHVRWVASDAGLTVTDEAIEQVIAQGAGSPRDTLSALELIASTGGSATEMISLDEFVEAMIEYEPGRALTMVARAINLGRDPRTLTEELIRFMRNGFLSLMAPDLVQLPSQRLGALTELSQRLGPAGLVRGIEHLGTALTEMRQAPDPRVLLDVAVVQLTSEQAATDVAGLALRIQKLERHAADDAVRAAARATSAEHTAPPDQGPVSTTETTDTRAIEPSSGRRQLGSRAAPATVDRSVAQSAQPVAPTESVSVANADSIAGTVPPTTEPVEAGRASPFDANDWEAVRPALRGMVKAVYSPAVFVSATDGAVVLGLPNDIHRSKCEQHRESVEAAINAHTGVAVQVELVVHGGGGGPGGGGNLEPIDEGPDGGATLDSPGEPTVAGSAMRNDGATTQSSAGAERSMGTQPTTLGALAHDVEAVEHPTGVERPPPNLSVVHDESGASPALNGRAIADRARVQGPAPDPEEVFFVDSSTLPADDEVDLDDLSDAPPEVVKTPLDRLAEAFPGSELVDDPY
jgi:DNA polymerase III subunit gamma/tau